MTRFWGIWKDHVSVQHGAGLIAALASVLILVLVGDARNRPVFDLFQSINPRTVRSTDVRVVVIDDDTVKAVGNWPWSRYAIARLIEGIASQNPKIIGLDMVFPEPDRNNPATFAGNYPELSRDAVGELLSLPTMDSFLAEVVGDTPTVIAVAGTMITSASNNATRPQSAAFDPALPSSVQSFPNELATIQTVRSQALSEGLINGLTDPDGTTREIQIAARVAGRDSATLSLEMLRQSQGGKPVRTLLDGGDLERFQSGDIVIPVNDKGVARLWFGRMPDEAFLSAIEFLAKEPTNDVRGKYVIVAVAATGTTDIVSIAGQGRSYGVDIHAQALDSMLKGELLVRPAWAGIVEWGTAFFLSAAVLIFANRVGRKFAIGIPIAMLTLILGLSFAAFSMERLLIDPVVPIGVGVSTAAIIALLRFVEIARAREVIHRAFDRYLSPELVARIAKDPSRLELGGEERDMTVLFCDVRGFSSISEGLSPNEIIQFLIGLLTPMTDILLSGKATIDKYVGDAIIAFWNAPIDDPRHAQNAADTALAMSKRLELLNTEMPHQSHYPWPGHVKIGIGLNAGMVCVGNMGSERRLNYSIIGDTVNLASRIEGMTKYYGAEIAIGDELAKRLNDYAIVEVDLVRVVGRDRPERIWLLLGDSEMATTSEFREIKSNLNTIVEKYRRRDWSGVRQAGRNWAHTGLGLKLSVVVSIYEERASLLEDRHLPEDWDGVYQAQSK